MRSDPLPEWTLTAHCGKRDKRISMHGVGPRDRAYRIDPARGSRLVFSGVVEATYCRASPIARGAALRVRRVGDAELRPATCRLSA